MAVEVVKPRAEARVIGKQYSEGKISSKDAVTQIKMQHSANFGKEMSGGPVSPYETQITMVTILDCSVLNVKDMTFLLISYLPNGVTFFPDHLQDPNH